MDFTREPIVESVITPRDGCKLVVRSSKGMAQEEFFVDALEMISFGGCFFFRSLERPKSFLVPVSDYEVIEVRDARMVLKSTSVDRGAIKIGGGRAIAKEPSKTEEREQKQEVPARDKKRRRQGRRRRGREDDIEGDVTLEEATVATETDEKEQRPSKEQRSPRVERQGSSMASPSLSSLLPPPKVLISDSIQRYKEDETFKHAFFDGNSPNIERSTENTDTLESTVEEPHQTTADDKKEASSSSPFGQRGGSEVFGEETVAEKPAPAFNESHWVIPGSQPEEATSKAEESVAEVSVEELPEEVVDESTAEEVSNQQGSQM
ncbi:Uncharacterized protein TC_0791 [Chlamydiales bacterium SCGC AG-110-P3]|nr:Uncharacterized protein TC_0791 [Chlamydiales bacterium SCGC AG-110-P3]